MALYKNTYRIFKNNNVTSLFMYMLRKKSDKGFPNCHRVIGSREIVGFGMNGDCSYIDNIAFPFPAIRFKEITSDLLPLKEKEKGDWRNLSIEEKKDLYRASYCQTYAEMMASSGVLKSIIGKGLIWTCVGVWLFMFIRWLWNTELPETYSEERQKAQLQRILALEINPMFGISSKWDYDANKWK